VRKIRLKNNFFLNSGICILSSILMFFSFPPFKFWYFSFFCLIPLFLICGKNNFLNFIYGLISGFIFYSLSLYWLKNVSGFIYLLLALYLSIYWAIFTFLIFLFKKEKIIFLGASIWFFLELIMANLLTGFPWLVFGLTQYKNLYISQVAKFTGIFGISFILVASNLFIYSIIKREFLSQQLFFIFFIIFCFLITKLPQKKEIKGRLKISLVQPNFAIYENTLEECKEKIIFYIEKKVRHDKPNIIIFPEGSFQGDIFEEKGFINKLKDLSRKNNFGILIGTFTKKDDYFYNSSVFINSERIEVYNKIHLVPYGEFILGEKFNFVKNIFLKIAGYYPKLKRGNEFKVFTFREIKFSTPICYENIFPEISENFLKNGSDFFIVITNDSWFGNSSGPYQHFYHNVFRAIETGRYFLQAGLTGMTGIIGPEGKIEKILEKNNNYLFFEDVLTWSLPVVIYETFYSKYGIYPFLLFCLILTGLLICRN